MALLKETCPRCGTLQATFDVKAQKSRGILASGWVEGFEIYSICRHCHRGTIFLFRNKDYNKRNQWDDPSGIVNYNGYINDFGENEGYVSLKDQDPETSPEHTPPGIASVYLEGTTCLAVKCYNASAAMFRSTIDIATKSLMPPAEEADPPAHVRNSLGKRLKWLFDTGKLPLELKEMAETIQHDGNDGVHDANLSKDEALDLKDFTFHLLERMYTLPMRIELSQARRLARRTARDGDT